VPQTNLLISVTIVGAINVSNIANQETDSFGCRLSLNQQDEEMEYEDHLKEID